MALASKFRCSACAPTFPPDGRRLATAGPASEALAVWDFEGRERLLTLGTDASLVEMAFSPDGTPHRVRKVRARRGRS